MDRLIRPPAGYWTRLLREEYVAICEGNPCAAMVLSQHEYWHTHNLLQRKKARYANDVAARGGQTPAQDTTLWSAISHQEMQAQLFGLFGERAIGEAYKYLVKRRFLQHRNNPRQTWDRKPQYLFDLAIVQAAVDELPARAVDEPDELPIKNEMPIKDPPRVPAVVAESTPQKCGEDGAGMRNGRRNGAESTPQKCGDSKNLNQRIQRTSERAPVAPGGFASLFEEQAPEKGGPAQDAQPRRVVTLREVEAEWEALPADARERYRCEALRQLQEQGQAAPPGAMIEPRMFKLFWVERKGLLPSGAYPPPTRPAAAPPDPGRA